MADGNYVLKIDGIDGESKIDGHEDELTIDSFSWGATNSGSFHAGTGGGGTGKVNMQDLHFVAPCSKASTSLMLACADGTHIGEATLTCIEAGGDQVEFYKVKLTDVLVSSYQVGGNAHSEVRPMDQFSLNFRKIEVEYLPQEASGSGGGPATAGWEIDKNKKV
jgi:type VI secretion system secreted protein Hcp